MRLLDLLDRGHSSEMLTIVFTETKRGADYLDNYLHDRGFSSTCIHGDRNQREREDAVRLFKVNIILDQNQGFSERRRARRPRSLKSSRTSLFSSMAFVVGERPSRTQKRL